MAQATKRSFNNDKSAPGKNFSGGSDRPSFKKPRFEGNNKFQGKPSWNNSNNNKFAGKGGGGGGYNNKFGGKGGGGGGFNNKFGGDKNGKPSWNSGNKFSGTGDKDGHKGFDKNKQQNGTFGAPKLDNNGVPEKTDWKKLKQEKKDLKIKRKQLKTKDLFELTIQAKQIYEKLKNKTTPNRDELARELHKLLGGDNNYSKLVMAHDTARVVQCMLKTAPADIKKEITTELIPIIPQMACLKYSHFCVARMLKYGSNGLREKIINSMFGHVVKMTSQTYSSSLIDSAYLTWATNKQKYLLRQEFYGDIYKKSKDDSVKCLVDTYKDSEHMKPAFLGSVKAHLEHAFNKKKFENSIIHAILCEYLQECSAEDREEIVTSLIPFIPSLISTKDGARSAILSFWHSSVKDRRAIIKSLKEHIVNMCTNEHGYVVLLHILATLDDTVGLKKTVLDPILENISSVLNNEWGRKVLQWIMCPADKDYFHPHLIANVEEGLKYSKKDVEVKRGEIKDIMEKPLCEAIAKNPKLWIQGGHSALATGAILKKSKGEHCADAFNRLAEVICDPEWKVLPTEENEVTEVELKTKPTKIEKVKKKKIKSPFEDDKVKPQKPDPINGVEHAGLHVAFKKMAKNDQEKSKSDEPTFGGAIIEQLSSELLKQWLQLNRGCFLLVTLFETGSSEAQTKIKDLVKEHKKLLAKQKHTGGKILLNKLEL